MKIAFLNDTSAWYHWGCTATSTVIREEIERRGHRVTSVSIQALRACHHLPRTGREFASAEFFEAFCKENTALGQAILGCDSVVVNGEGSLHRLRKLSVTILYLALAAKKFGGRNVQIINHSCYPDGGTGTPAAPAVALYRDVYRALDYVAIREHRSLEVMKRLGIEATLSFDCLPLYLERHPLRPVARSRSIVVAGSVEWHADGITALASYMRRMAAEGYEMTVLTGARSHPASDDAMFVDALRLEAPEGWRHVNAPSMEAWLETIARAELLLSGRFHHTIAACMLDTPAVILGSNTPKNDALAEMAQLPPPRDYATKNLEALLHERTLAAFGKPPISEAVKAEWRARAMKNFDAVGA